MQVKGTVTEEGKFGTPPHRVRALEVISSELGCQAIYAFVRFSGDHTTIRFAAAAAVAVLADKAEADYAGTNRYHVNIEQFAIDVASLDQILPN